MGVIVRKALIILIVLFGVFLVIGCEGNKPGTPNEMGTSEQAVTPAGAITEAVKETPAAGINPSEIVTPTEGNATERQNVTETPKIKEYTLEELANYNGKNGKTYVAYQGQVYDVSGSYLWKNGVHKGHSAGKDLTYELNSSPHGPGILKGYPVVGTLKK
jgi:predicted heme/steroid binding protein